MGSHAFAQNPIKDQKNVTKLNWIRFCCPIWDNWVLLVTKIQSECRDIACREFLNLVTEDDEVSDS